MIPHTQKMLSNQSQLFYPRPDDVKEIIDNLKKLFHTPYQIIVADAADAVSVNFSGRCKFLQI